MIVATWQPHESTIADVIASQNLKLDVILNKRAVMVVPAGIHKGSGLRSALERLELDPAGAMAIGDAENDISLFLACGFSAAVANALPEVKSHARLVTQGERGTRVSELIDAILDDRLIDGGRSILRIRRYRPDDLDALAQLFHESVHALAVGDYTAAQLQAWAPQEFDRERWQSRRSTESTWVAKIHDTIAGFTDLEPNGHLDMMFVHPDHARKGIATALLRHVERVALQAGLHRLFTEASLTARGFFDVQGFSVLERLRKRYSSAR